MSWLTRSGIKKPSPGADEDSQPPYQQPPEIRNDRASPVIEDERGVPSVNERSYRSKAVPLSIAAMALAIVAIIWLIPSPQTPVVATKGDPKASKNERFDENRLNAVLYPATPPALPEPPKPIVFEPPPPPPPLKIIPAPITGVAPPPPSGPKQITPLERRQQSKVLIIGASKTGGARKGSATDPLELPERAFVLTAASSADGDSGFIGAGPANDAAGSYGATRSSRARPAPALASADGPVVLTATPGPVGDRGFDGAAGAPVSAPSLGAGIGAGPDMGGVIGQGSSARSSAPNPDPLADSLRPTLIAGTAASRLASRTFMLTQGTFLDCNLDVAISSAVPGMTKCTLTRNVYGDDRRVVLLERGTEFTGQYRGALQQGQNRLFILWARAKTPKGVVINLASPGTDSLGRSGVTGFIDTHFWERFGAALFLSVVSDSISILAAQAQQGRAGNGNGNGNTTVVLPQSTTQAGKNAAAIAVENSIRIPPTLDKNQGGHVSIFIARDLDFRTVYALKAVGAR